MYHVPTKKTTTVSTRARSSRLNLAVTCAALPGGRILVYVMILTTAIWHHFLFADWPNWMTAWL